MQRISQSQRGGKSKKFGILIIRGITTVDVSDQNILTLHLGSFTSPCMGVLFSNDNWRHDLLRVPFTHVNHRWKRNLPFLVMTQDDTKVTTSNQIILMTIAIQLTKTKCDTSKKKPSTHSPGKLFPSRHALMSFSGQLRVPRPPTCCGSRGP